MPRKFFKRLLPDPARIKENRLLGLLGQSVHDSDLWHLNKHSVAGAFFIGVFCAFQPIPFQMLLAAFLAVAFKRNLALAVALVFISNPLTMAPIFYLNYRVGGLLFADVHRVNIPANESIGSWLLANFNSIGLPLLTGSLICGLAAGYICYAVIHLFWRWQVTENWRQRRLRRKLRKESKTLGS